MTLSTPFLGFVPVVANAQALSRPGGRVVRIRGMEPEDLDREIRVLEESIARMTRRLADLKRRQSQKRRAVSSTGTLPSMPAVRGSDRPSPPSTKRK
jgi:hypothetical protein